MFQLTSKNLTAALLIIIAASGYLLFNSYRDVRNTHEQAKKIIEAQQKKHMLVMNMYKAARERSIILLTMHATDDIFALDELNQALGEHARDFISARMQLMNMELDPEERQILNEQMELVRVNAPLQDVVASLYIEGNKQEAEKLLFEKAIPGQKIILGKIDQVLEFYERRTEEIIADIEISDEKASTDFQRLAASLLIIFFLLAFYIMRTSRSEKDHLVRSAEEMTHQATHDALTGLLNRRGFESNLSDLLATMESGDSHVVLYMDLDQFKLVNDTGGHDTGDNMLKQVADILRHCIRKSDTLARIGGDEFGIILETCDYECAVKIADSIIQKIDDYRFYSEKNTFRIGISIGMVEVDIDRNDISEIMKNIDSACYAAKDGGGNRYHLYTEDDESMIQRKSEMDWIIHIDHALEHKLFYLYAQPIVSTDPEKLELNYEFLIRMQTEDNEMIQAGAFLPAAERYNKIINIDRWVLEESFKILDDNPQFLDRIGYCSLNLSTQSLTDQNFLEFVIRKFKNNRELGHKICFEITETAAISNLIQAGKYISQLKALGVRFALDDFGSGLATFEYLKTLPIDILKIDGIFVRDITSDPIDRATVKSIHEVGSIMGKTTVAEFVENEQILEEVKAIGVDYVQGYHIGRPVPVAQVLDLRQRRKA
jgi:diguanylate cyclase (GGDEF)-like protein